MVVIVAVVVVVVVWGSLVYVMRSSSGKSAEVSWRGSPKNDQSVIPIVVLSAVCIHSIFEV